MIKILKPGTRQKRECDNCGALLEYDNSDIQSKYIEDSGYYQSYTKTYIICPQCKHEIECIKQIGE